MADEITTVVLTKMEVDTTSAVKSMNTLDDAIDETVDKTEEATKETDNYTSALDSMSGALGALPPQLQAGVKGLTNMTKGLKGVKVAIAATGIGALIIALGALFTWFNRTSEGQEKLRIGMAAVGQVMSAVMDTVADFGEAIFNAFSNPKQAVEDLWEAIKTNIINRVTSIGDLFMGLGRTIDAALRLDFDTVKSEVKDLGTAMIQFSTGLDDSQQQAILDGIGNKYNEIKDSVIESTALQARQNELERERIAFITREAELNTLIAEQRLAANNTLLETTEQLAASNEATALTEELFANQIALKEKAVELLREEQALGHNTLEDNRAMAEAEAELIALEQARYNALRELQEKNNTLQKARTAEIEEETTFQAKSIDLIQQKVDINKKAQDQIVADSLAAQQKVAEAQAQQIKEEEERQQARVDLNKEVGTLLVDNAQGVLRNFFGHSKKAAIADVVISTARAVAKVWGQTGVGGFFAQAAPIAMGIAQIAAIQKQTFALGGFLTGRSHSQGGVHIEAEGGEAIINKRSMANPYLRTLASQINEWGGGVAFAQNGMLVGQNGIQSAINSMTSTLDSSLGETRTVLVLEDFHTTNNKVIVTEDLATF